jgi:hypothetical protein
MLDANFASIIIIFDKLQHLHHGNINMVTLHHLFDRLEH